MNGCYRIQQDGFVSEYEYQELRDGSLDIKALCTGHFERLKDNPKELFLYNDDARIYHSIDKVSFLHKVSNAIEGEKLYPRPFITEQTDDEKKIKGYKFGSKIISTGDKVIISYVNGSIHNPLVIGSVEPFGSFYQNNFLLTKPDEWEQEKKRLENEDYILEYKDDSHGEFTLDITAKEKDATKNNQGGTGNITINLIGTENNGNVNLNLNGKAILTATGNVEVNTNGDAKVTAVGNVILNNGIKGGARLDDDVEVIVKVGDITVTTTGGNGANDSIVTLKGTITKASGTVKIGN
jgi:hypothetical protein